MIVRPVTQPTSLPVLGKYTPFLKLGQGGMADVYLAISQSSGGGLSRLAVIKRLRTDLVKEEEDDRDGDKADHFAKMFWDEAKLSMLLNHANVVQTFDACEEGGSLYLVMEYIEGPSLNRVQRELVKRGRRLPAKLAARVVADVLAGLHYAHELKDYAGAKLNIVHRDVSPQNVIVGYDGAIKLVDFGIAKAAFRSTETRAGTMKGKARYMPPEQILGKAVDRRADIYSAGVILWELLAQRKLVSGANMVEQLVAAVKATPPRLSTVVPDIDPELDAIVHKALAREPGDRYESAAEMREALLATMPKLDAGEGDLGAIVSELFKAHREEIASLIRQRVSGSPGSEGQGRVAVPNDPEIFVHLDEHFEQQQPRRPSMSNIVSLPTAGLESIGSVGPFVQVDAKSLAPAPQSSRLVPMLVASVGVLLLGIGALIGVIVASSKKETPVEAKALPQPPPLAAAAIAPRPAVVETVTPPTAPAPSAEAEVFESEPSAAKPAVARGWTAPTGKPRIAPIVPAPPPKRAASAPAEDSAEPTIAAPPGYVTLDTYPWTKVSVNGRALGNTPLVKVPLPPGTHTVVFENPTEGLRQTTTVVIKSGETTTKRLAF
ncbi:serine/threonine protein kinase [Labilithrix luteola]|uniref:Serine/threonine protein kinase n=1 Tax=Labilithrix luteola TaxID=1391654 RepID=A0A0K1QC89_9BACT|nr:serine/threonine-protein kinase [Labilithrix luteola]AKV03050.1 serine/threonine protein kinase [Labilithrix luteola]